MNPGAYRGGSSMLGEIEVRYLGWSCTGGERKVVYWKSAVGR